MFEQKNRAQLIDCVRRFMKLSDEQRCQMGVAGRDKMSMKFDRSIVVDRYREEVAKIL